MLAMMELLQKYNVACRLCGENDDRMCSIFDKNDEGLQIIHLINECLPVIVYRTDPLSKQVCVSCRSKLNTLYKFKKISVETANKHREQLKLKAEDGNESIKLYLGCESEMDNISIPPETNTVGTETDDIPILCAGCKTTILDSSLVNNEVELCAELHKAIADSLSINKVKTNSETEKGLRKRRKGQAFYHELDDSLCSSLTEFTNTESSHFDEYNSDYESYDTDSDGIQRSKRRKIELDKLDMASNDQNNDQKWFDDEVELRYFPLSLTNLVLNVINKTNLGADCDDYIDFYVKVIEPQCSYCRETFKNSKLLAVHEADHMSIELGDKVDNPILWHRSRDDADVRNKWLNSYDESSDNGDCDDELLDYMECDIEATEEMVRDSEQGLLIPSGTDIQVIPINPAREIVLEMTKPIVDGVPLNEYPKDERKSFYRTMKIGGVNKKFCSLCRYSFKDNWAIESHYFSSACYYTCRYCGIRFNKQRHRFDEHVQEHEERGDPLSRKIYAATKLNNVVPRIIQPDKVKKLIAQQDQLDNLKIQSIKMKQLFQPKRNIQQPPKAPLIKEEPVELPPPPPPPPPAVQQQQQQQPNKSPNQAYFCRKCYKVFFKLDEFNVHSKNCDYNNQFPAFRNQNSSNFNPNGEVLISPTGRPMRNCVRDAGPYKDESYIPEIREPVSPPQSFTCFVCNTPFPTIYSRNSHMRIHKGDINNVPSTSQKYARQSMSNVQRNSMPEIKQEPLEPEIQIYESEQNYNSVGAVSITPISKNPNQKATINPNIMKLVQNNPHLTIKANMNDSPPDRYSTPSASNFHTNGGGGGGGDSDKSYKCSSCWEAFSNKSHLYFHKKNQCEGSKYPCPFCKKRFGSETSYSSHIFYSHPE